jgi:hypothetical protein
MYLNTSNIYKVGWKNKIFCIICQNGGLFSRILDQMARAVNLADHAFVPEIYAREAI